MAPAPDPARDPHAERVGRVERSDPTVSEPWWCERFDFEAHSPRATFGLHVTVTRWPAARQTWYWTGVIEQDRPLASVVEFGAGSGRPTLELRTGGLWADHNVETPFSHWSVGLEAFAVGLDDPCDVFRAFRGTRVPLGYDVEWEMAPDDLLAVPSAQGYLQPANVHGEVLVGAATYELDGFGTRSHTWGPMPATGMQWRGRDVTGAYLAAWEDGEPPWPTDGLPVLTRSPWGPVEVIGWSPARLPGPDGTTFDVARGLWRCIPTGPTGEGQASAEGAAVAGWVEVSRVTPTRG